MLPPFLWIFLGLLLLSSGTSRAQNSDEQAWLEMMEVCVLVISEQSDRFMDEFPSATALVNIGPLPERAVRHPGAHVIASAVSDGSQWFLCLVAGDPAIKVAQSGGLIGTITGTLAKQINQSNDHTVVLKNAFAPVRVTCQDDGRLTATFAVSNKDRELRIAVTNNLPSSVANPCLEADEEADQDRR